jgi:hypothetical protein
MDDELRDDELRDQLIAWVDALDVGEPVTPDEARELAIGRRRRVERRRRLAVVAAGVVLLAGLGGVLVRSGDDDSAVTAGSAVPRSLDEFADHVAVLPTTVLGETDDARYTYRRGVMTISEPTSETITYEEQSWTPPDGLANREINPAIHETALKPPSYDALIPASFYLRLTDDVDAVEAVLAMRDLASKSALLVDVLTYAGLPGPARAGMLRTLSRLGMVPVAGANPGPNLFRAEGPGGSDGLRIRADFDLRTGLVVAWNWYHLSDSGVAGGSWQFTVLETDLRRDMEGS